MLGRDRILGVVLNGADGVDGSGYGSYRYGEDVPESVEPADAVSQ